nr:MAG TPA: hypothetical protein [Caudoviricetes sp.]
MPCTETSSRTKGRTPERYAAPSTFAVNHHGGRSHR